jgi:hypothetical protein
VIVFEFDQPVECPFTVLRSRARNEYVPVVVQAGSLLEKVPLTTVTPCRQFTNDPAPGFMIWTSKTRPAGGLMAAQRIANTVLDVPLAGATAIGTLTSPDADVDPWST